MNATVTYHAASYPIVALVGRVNVGKSTLFNRLLEKQKAIVSSVPGTTRTMNEGEVLWRGTTFRLIDTGGLSLDKTMPFEEEILKQNEKAVAQADLILFVTDGKTGILPDERELAKTLRRKTQKTILVIGNKMDNTQLERTLDLRAWFSLGLGEPILISALNSRKVGNLLDRIHEELQKKNRPPTSPEPIESFIHVSLIGKPNVGKSSLFNKLIGQDKVIVSPIPHTTREPYDTTVLYNAQVITFIDTAGIRRKAQVKPGLEKLGIQKSIKTITESDIILFVLDSTEPISSQDKQLGSLLERQGKSVIIVLNKWDLSEDNSEAARQALTRIVRDQFPHLHFAPIIVVSGLTGYRVQTIFPLIMRVNTGRRTTVPGSALEHFLKLAVKRHPPTRGKGTRFPKILGITQIGTAPPVIELLIKFRTSLHVSYTHFLEHALREQFDFTGTPVIIRLKKQRK